MSITGEIEALSVSDWGGRLHSALRNREPIAPLTQSNPDMTVDFAYAIQNDLISRRIASEGSRVVGRKIGVTSKPVQDMLDVREPDFGQLLSSMMHHDEATVKAEGLINPRAEGEIAFILSRDLEGPGVNPASVLYATEYVVPCFEIVDSRIRDWKIRIQDTVADNASSGEFVLGAEPISPRRIDLALVGMTIEKNGSIVGTGAGAAALGHPLNAVTWLANTLGRLGVALRAGDIILSGALSALVPITAGDVLRVTMGGLGSASMQMSGAKSGHA